jgi:hypothetical protein
MDSWIFIYSIGYNPIPSMLFLVLKFFQLCLLGTPGDWLLCPLNMLAAFWSY